MKEKKMRFWSITLLLLLSISACIEEKRESREEQWDTSLTLNMARVDESVLNNTQVYLFDGGVGSNNNRFNGKVQDVTYEAGRLKMPIAAGTWNVALVSANREIKRQLIAPVRTDQRASLKMWETATSGGVLPSMPELRTAYITGQRVVAGTHNAAADAMLLTRNVALVKVVIADAGGLDLQGTHRLQLTHVPTVLNWNGGLYPNRRNPTVSRAPMSAYFSIRNNPHRNGRQLSDTLQFVIPAHKGVDYLHAYPTDTTTSHLKLNVSLACMGGTRYEKTAVTIPRVPRVNGILLVRLTMRGRVEVSTEVLEWLDSSLVVDLSHTQLFTDKSAIELAHKDTFYVNTNAATFTVKKASDAAWITSVRKLTGNAVEVTADVTSYVDNHPRSSYILLKANNVTKKITVTQRPDRGTIQVDAHRLVFSPLSPHRARRVQVTSLGGNWEILAASPKATANIRRGLAGTTAVTFTRSSTTNEANFASCYGDGQVVVKNTTTLDTDTISLINCLIAVDQHTIHVNTPRGPLSTIVTRSQEITVYGGNQRLLFNSRSPWIHENLSWNPTSPQTLTMTTDREPNGDSREGFLTIAHAELPDYVVSLKVFQDVVVTIPPFDYFVVKFTFLRYDADFAVEFRGNHPSGNGANNNTYDKKPVGYAAGEMVEAVQYKGVTLLHWGGDALAGEGETVFFNAPVLEGDTDSPRKIKLDIYATWYTYGLAPREMTFTMTAYKGGTMSHVRTNFHNSGGQVLYNMGHRVIIRTTRGQWSYAEGGYTKVATITYDRIKHSATAKVWATIATSEASSQLITLPLRVEEKPHSIPIIVETYSDGYAAARE